MKTQQFLSIHIKIDGCNKCQHCKTVFDSTSHHASETKFNHDTMDELIVIKRTDLTEIIESAVRKELNTCLFPKGSANEDDEVFTNKQAMEYLHVSRSTLQRWRKSGQLPYRKVEGKILYTKSDLKQLLKSALK